MPNKTATKGKRRTKEGVYLSNQPRVSYRDVATCWFLYQNEAYCVQSAPVTVLKQAVTGMVHDERGQNMLQYECLDMISRWYILVEAKGLKLYKSREEAERSLKSEQEAK